VTTKLKPSVRFVTALGLALGAALLVQWRESAQTQTLLPPVMTDKTGYLLGETVQITGTGYTPGDVFTLQVTHADGAAEAGMGHESFQAVVGDDGIFTATWAINEEDAAGHDFVLNATGGIAGAAPAWTFSRIATVGTDKFDYQPGETATIVGAGFDAGETVTITIQHSNTTHSGLHPPFEVAADADGNALAQWYVEPETSKDSMFRLTAVGALSALTATTSFTDAFVMVIDDGGPDDAANQRDLSFMAVDHAPATGNLGVMWGWDDTAWPGGSTGDACAMFDTDADGSVNYVLCVTVGGNPAAQVAPSPRLFLCNDASLDRCTGPTPILAFTSTATASVVAGSDPFAGVGGHPTTNCNNTPGCRTADTVANLTVRFSDFVVAPGFSARLRNVCSYGSNNPNSNPADCAAVPTNGFLTIKKTTQTPFSTSTAFVFNSSRLSQNGTTSWTANIAGAQTDVAVASLVSFAPGLLNLSEVVPPNWDLTDATCVVQGSTPTSTGTFSGTTVTGVSIQTGLETICTFSNERQNAAPTADDDTATVAEDSGATTIDVLDGDTDPDGDTLSVTAVTQPTNGTVAITNSGADVSYTPNANLFGTDTFNYTVNDGNGGTDTGSVTVTVTSVNDDPVANNDSATVNEDSSNNAINVLTNDTFAPDTGETLSVTAVTDPPSGTAAFTATGVTYTPDANFFGTDTFDYTVSDGNGGTASATVTVTVKSVNDAPNFSKGGDQVVNEDSGPHTVPGWATAISAGPANESGQAVTFVITANDNPGLFSAGPAVAANGTLTYSLAANANGVANLSLKITDDGGTDDGGVNESAPQSFIITVNAVNDAPSFTKGANDTVNEDSGARSVPGWATAISAGPADEAGQTLTFNVSNDNNALFSVQPTLATNGTLTYTPAPDAFGTATVTVTLSDNGGTANGGADTSAPETFTITVSPINDAPSFTKGPDQSVNEDAGPQTVPSWATGISAGPNEGSQTVSFEITGNTNSSLFSAGPSVQADGTLTYTPAANEFGTAQITLVIKDDGGTASGGQDTSPPQTFVIDVAPVNDAPSFTHPGHQSVPEDSGPQTVNGFASSMSPGPANENSQTLSFSTTNNNTALFSSQPTVADNTGTLTYTSAPDAHGTATVTVKLTDSGGTANGGDNDSEQTFVITITSVNDAPAVSATASPASIDEHQSATVSGSFTDPDTGDTHTVTISWGDGSPPTTISLAAGVVTYSATHQYKDDNPTNTASDLDTVTVTVTDNGSPQGTGTANTSVTVNNVPPAITSVVGPTVPQPINAPIAVTAHFTDVGTQDTHSCSFDWDDPPSPATNGVVTESNGSDSCTATHVFAAPGVYSVKVTVTDDDTGSAVKKLDLEYIVVFDPNGGFVTGGGFIMSPPGASPAFPTATGKANFGFVSKYKKGSNVPEGQTEFQFNAGDLNFHSSAYDYGSLVVTGHKALYRGTGTVNGVPGYRFVLIAYDGQQPGGGGVDRFRIKITLGGALIYDNRMGLPEDIDTADPTAISGGSIVIHEAKGK
jgi:hypothetical protein